MRRTVTSWVPGRMPLILNWPLALLNVFLDSSGIATSTSLSGEPFTSESVAPVSVAPDKPDETAEKESSRRFSFLRRWGAA